MFLCTGVKSEKFYVNRHLCNNVFFLYIYIFIETKNDSATGIASDGN